MRERKVFTIAIPASIEEDVLAVKEVMKRVTDLARIHNKKSNKKYPENMAELLIYGMEDACEKLLNRLEGKITEEEIAKLENHRQYLREYYRGYRERNKDK